MTREKNVEERILDIVCRLDPDITRDNDIAIVERKVYDYYSGKERPKQVSKVSTKRITDVIFDVCVSPKDGSGIEFFFGIVNQPTLASITDIEISSPELGEIPVPEELIESTKEIVLLILEKAQRDVKKKNRRIVPYLDEKFSHIESFLDS